MFKDFKMAYYSFIVEAEDEGAVLPSNKVSLFFQKEFKEILHHHACKMQKNECGDCLLKFHCAYALMYENLASTSQGFRRYGSVPAPFVWKPPLEKKTDYFKGEKIIFNLVLLGKGTEYAELLIRIFQQFVQKGLTVGKGKLDLKSVLAENPFTGEQQLIYGDGADNISKTAVYIKGNQVEDWARENSTSKSFSLLFLAPALIAEEDEYLHDPRFFLILRELLKRVQMIYYFHHDFLELELEISYHEVIEKAKKVQIKKNQVTFSNADKLNKNTADNLPGLLGKVDYTGDNKEGYLPFLKLGEFIHLGHKAELGYGRYRLRT